MADKTTDQLVELTTLEANDLLLAYDVSEVGDEKIKKITKTNAFAGVGNPVGYIKAERNSTQSIPNNTAPYTPTAIVMTSIGFRSSTAWTINGAGAVVIPEGIKCIHALGMVYWAVSANGDRQQILLKNGVPQHEDYRKANSYDCCLCSSMMEVSVGDQITFGLRQSSGGGALNIQFGNICVHAIA
jgi:hypothetical protein